MRKLTNREIIFITVLMGMLLMMIFLLVSPTLVNAINDMWEGFTQAIEDLIDWFRGVFQS